MNLFSVARGWGCPAPPGRSGGDLHPLLLVAVDHHGSAAEFDAPVEGNVHSVLLAGEELRVVDASALGGGAPGDEGHVGSGVELVQYTGALAGERGQHVPPPGSSHGGRHLGELIATDCQVDKLTHGVLVFDHQVEIGNELCRIGHVVGIVTPTIEGNSHLTVLHFADVFDGAGLELEHDVKKVKG